MWNNFERALRDSWTRTIEAFAAALPGVLVLILVVALSVVAAMAVRAALMRALRGVDLQRRADAVGLPRAEGPGARSLASLIGAAAFWLIIVVGLLVGLTAFDAPLPNRLAMHAFEYLPNFIAGVLIFVGGGLAARFLGRTVLIGAVNMRIGPARFLSIGVKWLVLLVATAMALEHLGIGRTVLFLAFGLLFGGVVLALALAVGLGARDVVRRALEREWQAPPPGGDKLDHV
jgi:hypothetical protein